MGKLIMLILCTISLTACSSEPAKVSEVQSQEIKEQKIKAQTITGQDYDKNAGADSYGNAGDHEDSKYYVNPDFYNMKSDENLTILPNYKTMQQTTEWSCGNITALTALNYLGIQDYTEMMIAEKMGSHTDDDKPNSLPGSANNSGEYGTTVEDIYKFFSNVDGVKVVETSYKENYKKEDLIDSQDGFTPNDEGNLFPTFYSNSLYASENSDTTEAWVDDAKDSYFVKWITDNLKNNRLIMVEWGDWDGHWQTIIGYDTLGTPSMGDDIIIFADPYDTSDHWQDGYYYYPAERFFYMWKDRNVAPKPYQLQPYVVVEKVK